MKKISKRWLPGTAVLSLLALALVTRNSPVSAHATPDEIALSYPTCTNVTAGGIGDTTTFTIAPGQGIVQPLGDAPNMASCILSIAPADWCQVGFDLSYWDPATLAPSAQMLALRTWSFPATTVAQFKDATRVDFYPPLITRALPNVAEPPPSQVVARWQVAAFSENGRHVTLAPNDITSAPPAYALATDGSPTPIAGTHPGFVRELCGGDAALQAARVVQSVMTTDEAMDAAGNEYIQKFRVPVETRVNWIEVAFAPNTPGYNGFGVMQVFDAQGQAAPPPGFGTPILSADYSGYTAATPGQWMSHVDLTSLPTLQPNHDYWLVLTTAGLFRPFSKLLNGTESPYFKESIGGLWAHSVVGLPVNPLPGRALSFRIIGTPTGTTGVGDPGPRRGGFALAVSPNPARGATSITWAGASPGAVSLEVIDPRGRRVASATSDAGRWSWNGSGADGRALPAGVYFVRARDGAGLAASARVTLVH